MRPTEWCRALRGFTFIGSPVAERQGYFGKESGVVFESNPSPASASDELVQTLTALQLCRTQDFQRAKGFVRRLAGDLPAFDSVWIDALVQLRRLTPYQARVIEQAAASELRVGPFVLVDELGRGPRGTTCLAMRLLAKTSDRSGRCVVKRLVIAANDFPENQRRLNDLLERTAGWSHPNLVVPDSLLSVGSRPRASTPTRRVSADVGKSGVECPALAPRVDDEAVIGNQDLATVSRFVEGVPLSELLVRRGRFPASAVIEVARQLLSGLASLDTRGLVHGDIRLSNVRLTDRGAAVLVDGGIRPAVCPELTIHVSLSLESYDGIAPELIGTGIAANAGTELYGLGCLLWQLLAGRPPYPMADPLMKLAAHQTRRIEDVREWAPETPAPLAQAIYAMTSPAPEQRPRSFNELLQRWGHPGAQSRSRLRRFRRAFHAAVPHLAQPAASMAEGRWPWIAVSLFVVAGAVMSFANTGVRNELLALTSRVVDVVRSRDTKPLGESSTNKRSVATEASMRVTEDGLLLLPPPSADGVVLLAEPGPYTVADIAHAGSLTIRGAAGINPVIHVGREPLRLAATEVTLANVAVRRNPREREARVNTSPLSAMLLIRSNRVSIEGCEFETDLNPATTGSITISPTAAAATASLAWLPRDEAAAENADSTRVVTTDARSRPASLNRQFAISNTVFRGSGAAVLLAETPDAVTLTNCLKVGGGAFLTLGRKAAARSIAVELARVTLRDSGPFLLFGGAFAEQASAPTIQIVANDCVFALRPATNRLPAESPPSTSPSLAASLIEIQTARPRSQLSQSIHWQGRDSFVPPGLELLVVTDPTRGTIPVANADEQFESLLASEFEFSGLASDTNADSRLTRLAAPRSSPSASLPGFDPALLPTFSRE